MKYSYFLTLTSTLIISSNVFAERSMALFGGGGEPKNVNKTIFDGTLNGLDGYLQGNKWTTQISFNGGHSETEAILSMKFNDAQNKSSFTPGNYNAIIKYYENQIKSGKMKSGDQLMLMIDSHGAVQSGNQSTHQIAIGQAANPTDLNDLKGTPVVSLDTLKSLTDLAKQNGIKLAILDFSCHSGNSLSLANSNTCVISSTGPNHFGYNTFSDNFISKMKAGKSLEDVFLDTRKATDDNSYPMISSPAGVSINADLYPDLTPYLYYYEKNPNEDKMSNYLLQASSKGGTCARENQYADLLKQLDGLRAITALNMEKSWPEIANLKKLIGDYKNRQDEYINQLRTWGVQELNRVEQFQGTGTSGKKTEKMNQQYTWREILETDYDAIISNVTNAKKSAKDPSTIAMFQASIDMHTKGKAKQQEIISQFPSLKDYKQKFKEQVKAMDGTYATANQIALEERKLYDKIYKNLRTEKTSASNPCKDFLL